MKQFQVPSDRCQRLRAKLKSVGSISENHPQTFENTVGTAAVRAYVNRPTPSADNGDGVLRFNAVEEIDISTAGGLISTNSHYPLLANRRERFFLGVRMNPERDSQTNYMLTRAGSFLPNEKGNLAKTRRFTCGYP